MASSLPIRHLLQAADQRLAIDHRAQRPAGGIHHRQGSPKLQGKSNQNRTISVAPTSRAAGQPVADRKIQLDRTGSSGRWCHVGRLAPHAVRRSRCAQQRRPVPAPRCPRERPGGSAHSGPLFRNGDRSGAAVPRPTEQSAFPGDRCATAGALFRSARRNSRNGQASASTLRFLPPGPADLQAEATGSSLAQRLGAASKRPGSGGRGVTKRGVLPVAPPSTCGTSSSRPRRAGMNAPTGAAPVPVGARPCRYRLTPPLPPPP